jgi:pyruvate dehydrogenase (quinone)
VVAGQVVQVAVLLGGQVGGPVGVAQPPVGVRDTDGIRDLAEVVADRLAGDLVGQVAEVRGELSLPPKLTYGQIKGFTLYATRTILSGGGEELIELTKTNLRELEVE